MSQTFESEDNKINHNTNETQSDKNKSEMIVN